MAAKTPSTNDIMTTLLSGKSQEALQPAEKVEKTSPPALEAPQQPARKRRRYETHTRQVHRERGKREQERQRRELAEAWWQALRRWDTEEGQEIRVYYGNPKPSGVRLVGIAIGTAVSNSYTTHEELVKLPNGTHPAALVGHLCAASPHLTELHRGAGLATLIHSSGRGWASQRAKECGEAVLQLADSLGAIDQLRL